MFSWKNPFQAQDSGYLAYRGEMEHYNLAKNYLSLYPSLFDIIYEPYRYPFRSTQAFLLICYLQLQ